MSTFGSKLGQDVVIDQSTIRNDRSLSSEARLKRRIDEVIKSHVDNLMKTRAVTDLASSGPVKVKVNLNEPTFTFDRETGSPSFVIVGNPIYKKGDRINKPPQGWSRAMRGRGASKDGGEEDEFIFQIESEEIENRLFEELELPNLEDRVLHRRTLESRQHAGYTTDGPPAMLDVPRTFTRSLGRRLALKRPTLKRIHSLEEEIERLKALDADDLEREKITALEGDLLRLRRRRMSIPYFDTVDLQYRKIDIVTEPVTSAVVFALMDVSGSMDEHLKELAKRFFWLLRRFLMREYDSVEMVWIRHTAIAEEVSERDFFFSQHTGGTAVHTALELMVDIQKDRFPLDMHNIYLCQASDGDAGYVVTEQARRQQKASAEVHDEDAEYSADLLRLDILPIVQYAAYLECRHSASSFPKQYQTALWNAYEPLTTEYDHFVMRQVAEVSQIYPVFQNLFKPAKAPAHAA
jgi:hypothetical protein